VAAIVAALAWSFATIRLDGVRDAALSWHIPPAVPVYRGARLFMDAGPRAPQNVKIAREILRANPRIAPVDALLLATEAIAAARAHGLDPAFFAATLLQESAFDPGAVSSAGAIGIAQFTVPTADTVAVDPWDPSSAIGGAARLLSAYASAYRASADPYALALAAYNAGPAAVAAYHGVPPDAETREYIADIRERWSRIVGR
jgi:soluble lytic murein transglycosylase-like protein